MYTTTVESREVAAGLRIEVTTHLPHRPWRIDAYLVRPGSDMAEPIETMALNRGNPRWSKQHRLVPVPAATLLEA